MTQRGYIETISTLCGLTAVPVTDERGQIELADTRAEIEDDLREYLELRYQQYRDEGETHSDAHEMAEGDLEECGIAYVELDGGTLYEIDETTGERLWEINLP
ncbi:MAG: hypothetical protein ACK52I_29290 [Pseudomonadota bacterium]